MTAPTSPLRAFDRDKGGGHGYYFLAAMLTAAIASFFGMDPTAVIAIAILPAGLGRMAQTVAEAAWDKWHAHKALQREARGIERERRLKEWMDAEKHSCSADTGPMLSADASPRFSADDPEMLSYLDDNGYVVIRDVANTDEIHHAHALLWEFLKEQASMSPDDPTTWTDHNFRAVGDPTNGIVSGNGFGHSQFCWFIRTLPRVKQAFASVWGTASLITSFDGGNVFRPHQRQGCSKHRTMGGWWHVDQGRNKRGRHAVQGLVSLFDANAQTGGLCVVPGSHRLHEDLMTYTITSPDGADFVVVPAPQVNPVVRHGTLVTCRAGDLVLWDSRTIHCNTPSLEPPSKEKGCRDDALLRAVAYVCMTPRYLATRDTLDARKKAAAVGMGSTHWPHEFHAVGDPALLSQVDVKGLSQAALEGRISQQQLDLI